MLPDFQLRGPHPPADQGGVGAQALYKGVPGPLQGGLVLRLPHRALLLGGYGKDQAVVPPLQKEGAGAVDEGEGHRVHLGLPLGGLGVEGAPLQQGEQLPLGDGGQHGVLGQGAQNVVVEPLRPGLAVDVADGGPALAVPVEENLPL